MMLLPLLRSSEAAAAHLSPKGTSHQYIIKIT
jgi:hypothetical protein